jgi:hypothetical protein
VAESVADRANKDPFWTRHPELEPEPQEPRAGLFLDSYGRRLPISLTAPKETDEHEPFEAFEPAEAWADTIGRALKQRPPLVAPELPRWTEALDLATTNRLRALLTVRQVALASAEKTATHIRRIAERLASSFTADDERKTRQISDDRAEALLRGLLRLADDLERIVRSDADRFYARRETMRVSPRSKRRTELLKLYAGLLRRNRLTRGERIRLDIAEIFAEASRCRAKPAPKACWWWQPTDVSVSKNKAVSQGYARTPVQTCTYNMRGREHAALSVPA